MLHQYCPPRVGRAKTTALLVAIVVDVSIGWVAAAEPLAVLEQDRAILDVVVSPDGAQIAAADADGTLTLWDLVGRSKVAVLSPGLGALYGASFSPDGATLAIAGHNGKILLWSVSRREKSVELAGHTAPVRCVAFCPTGKYLVSGSADMTAKVWDLVTLQELRTLDTDGVRDLAFSRSGGLFVTTSGRGIVSVWKTDTLSEAAKEYNGPYPTCAAISPDEKSLVIGGRLSKVDVISLTDGAVQHALDFVEDRDPSAAFAASRAVFAHSVNVWDVEFSPAGDSFAIAGRECWQTIRPYIFQKLVLVRMGGGWEQTDLIMGELGSVTSLCFLPDGKQLVSADVFGRIKIWAIDSE